VLPNPPLPGPYCLLLKSADSIYGRARVEPDPFPSALRISPHTTFSIAASVNFYERRALRCGYGTAGFAQSGRITDWTGEFVRRRLHFKGEPLYTYRGLRLTTGNPSLTTRSASGNSLHRKHKRGNRKMPLLQVIITLIVVGILLWLVNHFIPMTTSIKSILNAVVVIAVVLWLLNIFGLLAFLSNIRVGR